MATIQALIGLQQVGGLPDLLLMSDVHSISLASQGRCFRYEDFTEFDLLVGQNLPPLVYSGLTQAKCVRELLQNKEYGCKSILVEDKYIDKGFVDEHREFYGSSFTSYDNSCKRLHFFSVGKIDLEKKIRFLEEKLRKVFGSRDKYLALCRKFSDEYYLGFAVIKPLRNTRVGRTVLRHPHRTSAGGHPKFQCTRRYVAHIFGLELSVCGLPFQQQDGGMSACASTATWSSLNHVSDLEHLTPPSPASITKLATKEILPFGRPIPQENGLTIVQMCQAIQATGMTPYLTALAALERHQRKSLLYSAVRSGFAPILVIRNRHGRTRNHAVTVAGYTNQSDITYRQFPGIAIGDLASRVDSVYINDDRIGPYFRAPLIEEDTQLTLVINSKDPREIWEITHILVPLHNKIRFAFTGLHEAATKIVCDIVAPAKLKIKAESKVDTGDEVAMESWIMKARDYKSKLLFGKDSLRGQSGVTLNEYMSFPRYIGVVQVRNDSIGTIDVVIDTTNTLSHSKYLLVIGRPGRPRASEDLVKVLSEELECPYLLNS